MEGISSKAAGKLENKKKYQQYEWNTDFDADIYESYYRTYDPQIGRFLQIDPSPKDFESPFVSMGNNPVSNVDPRGDNWWDIVAATLISIVDNTVAGSNLRETYKPADPADFNNALRSADASMLTVGAAMMVDGTRNMGGGAVLLAAGGAGVPVIIVGALEAGVGADISVNATLNISKGYNYGIDQEAMQRGRDNETKALKEEELKKNTKPESVTDPKTEKKVTTIPDSYTDQKATVDVKDTKKVNYTKQLRAQEVISKKNGQKPVIITGPNTKVSTTVDKKFTIVTKPYLGPQ